MVSVMARVVDSVMSSGMSSVMAIVMASGINCFLLVLFLMLW